MKNGITFIIIASFFFSIINILVKYLSQIPAIEIVFFRSLVSLLISGTLLIKHKIPFKNKYWPLLIGRGLSGALALSLYFYAIQVMPLATAVTIFYLAPIFTVLLAIFMVGESPSPKQWPFLLLAFVGSAFIKNTDVRVEVIPFIISLVAAFFAGMAYNFIRKLKGKADTHLIILYFPLITIPFCLPFMLPIWKTPNMFELALLILIGLCTQLAQVFMTKAYTMEKASRISHYNYLTTFWAVLSGFLIFNEKMNIISIFGMVLIFIGIFFSARLAPKS